MELDSLTEKVLMELNELDEAKSNSNTTISRQTKIKKAAGQLASVAARKRNDPLYQRMIKYRELYYKYREMVHQKYSPKVRRQVRR